MPYSPQRPCRAPGCPHLAERGHLYCTQHSSLEHTHDHDRTAAERGYTYRWQKASRAYLRAHPLCAECARHGQYTKADVVDHITPHRGDYSLFWDKTNWQPLCKECHDRKTGEEDTRVNYGYKF